MISGRMDVCIGEGPGPDNKCILPGQAGDWTTGIGETDMKKL